MTRKMISRATRFGWLCASFLFLLSMVPSSIAAQDGDGMFTIYLVRHAEKQSDSNDPPLTECGVERSESLSTLFDAVPFDAVYSTDYKRTQSTALPTATDQGLKIQLYEPDALGEIAAELLLRNGARCAWWWGTAIPRPCSRECSSVKKWGHSTSRFTIGCTKWLCRKTIGASTFCTPHLIVRDVNA